MKDIEIKEIDKSLFSYNFVKQYLDIINYEDYINNINLYQIATFHKDKMIGLSIYKMRDYKIHLNYFVVDKAYRGYNINNLMLNYIEELAVNSNINLITVNIRKSNISSYNSLLRSFYIVNNNSNLYYADGEKKITLYKKL